MLFVAMRPERRRQTKLEFMFFDTSHKRRVYTRTGRTLLNSTSTSPMSPASFQSADICHLLLPELLIVCKTSSHPSIAQFGNGAHRRKGGRHETPYRSGTNTEFVPSELPTTMHRMPTKQLVTKLFNQKRMDKNNRRK